MLAKSQRLEPLETVGHDADEDSAVMVVQLSRSVISRARDELPLVWEGCSVMNARPLVSDKVEEVFQNFVSWIAKGIMVSDVMLLHINHC
jgi:hypothetical protein